MKIFLVLLISMLCCDPLFAADALTRAKAYIPLYRELLDAHWSGMPLPHLPCGQVEQESSWKERATLKTSRELGSGLTQMTIAYRSDGSERFNIYREAVKWRALRGWDWQSDPYNVRYQLTFLVLQDRSNFTTMRTMFLNDTEAWKAALICYNAGPGRVMSRRSVARIRGQPMDRWTGGLDSTYNDGEKRLLYGRPLWKAVNEYPLKVFQRAEKYRIYLDRQ